MSEIKQELLRVHQKIAKLFSILIELAEYVGWEKIEPLINMEYNVNHLPVNSKSPTHLQLISDSEMNKYHFHYHQDILIDDASIYTDLSDNSNIDRTISCEEQVYRLTAQLTAAYHRIASLEDQLFAIRHDLETRQNSFYHGQ